VEKKSQKEKIDLWYNNKNLSNRSQKMKKIILSAIVSSALMLGAVGCGDNSNKATSHAKVQKVDKKVSTEDRKKALQSRIQGYAKYGFDINQTSANSYLLSVKDPAKSVDLFLNIFNLGYSLDTEDKQELQEIFKDAKFDVSVDWDKYVSNTPRSVEVNYIGKGGEIKDIKKLLSEKKVGAYLTYQGSAELKKIEFKNLNETISENNETVKVSLKDTVVDIKQLPDETNDKRVYTISSKEMDIGFLDEFGSMSVAGYKDLICDIDKSNAYLGSQDCKIPTINMILDKSGSDETNITMNNLVYGYATHANKGKADEDIAFKIDSIDINKAFSINDIKANLKVANIDENILKEYMQLMENPSSDAQKDLAKLMKLAGEIYSGGATMDYTLAIDNIKGSGEGIEFALNGYKDTGKAKFDSNITYDDKSTIKLIKLNDATNKANAFELSDFRFGYGIYDLFNLIPGAMDMLGDISTETNATKVDEIVQNKGMKVAQNVLNQGFGIYIKPLGYDAIKFSDTSSKTNFDLGKTDIQLDVKLLKNDLKADIDNPMMPMMLLSYLKADGKITIPAKDLQTLSKNPSFAMIGMFMMMAKMEGDNAVFVIEFKDGKLLVNGQPMM
jgi:hypothetical protein